jgi:hypothetical protein
MDSSAERRAQAQGNVEAWRLIVHLQRQVVHQLRANGYDSKVAEALLCEFERLQDVLSANWLHSPDANHVRYGTRLLAGAKAKRSKP